MTAAYVVAAAVLVALAFGVLLGRRVRVHARVKAMADARGDWSAAAGGAIGPIAFTAGLSRAGAAWTAHLLGRTVARGKPGAGSARIDLSPARAWRAWETVTTALRRIRFDRVDARVRGAADDPATSAQVMGLLEAASAVLEPRARIASEIDWMSEAPFVNVECDLEASFVPLLFGWDVARATLKGQKA